MTPKLPKSVQYFPLENNPEKVKQIFLLFFRKVLTMSTYMHAMHAQNQESKEKLQILCRRVGNRHPKTQNWQKKAAFF